MLRATCLAALCLAAPPVSPRLAAQRRVPIDNAHVRVVVVTDPAGSKTALHEHAMNRVMVYLDPGRQRVTYEDGRVEDVRFQPGEARWSPAGGRHISENPGAPYRVVEVELKNAGSIAVRPGPLDPVRVKPDWYRVTGDYPQVRLLRVSIPAGARVPLHEHSFQRVVVYLNGARVRVTPEGGKPSEAVFRAGDVVWSGTARHEEENLSSSPFEVVVVEVK